MPPVADLPSPPARPEGIVHRSYSGPIERVRAEGDADDVHRYTFRASSDAPVEMWGRIFEILDHGEDAVRMDWLRSGNAPMLGMHNRYDQVGVIESAELGEGHISVTVRIAPSQTDLIADLEAGVVRNVSIGYRIYDEKLESREQDEDGNTIKSTWRTTDWEPNEVSYGLGKFSLNFKSVGAKIPFSRKARKQTTPQLDGLLTGLLRRRIDMLSMRDKT